MPGHVVDKIVLVSGTTGLDLRRIYDDLKRNPPGETCVYHFEEIVESTYKVSRCSDIEQLVAMMLVSKPTAVQRFREAVEALKARLSGSGCRKAVVFIHLTYLSRQMVVANPVLGEVLGLGGEAAIIYMVDDFYDALHRIALRLRRRLGERKCATMAEAPFRIDPVLYLSWRATDTNILGLADELKPGVETFVFSIKHPYDTWRRLIEHVTQTRSERLRSKGRVLAYASHPISSMRKLYVHGGYDSLSRLKPVMMIEAFKEAVREVIEGIVLFEPTTIDELLEDPWNRITPHLPCEKADALAAPVNHSLVIARWNRWPLPDKTLWEEATGLEYPYRRDGALSILGREFPPLYGEDLYTALVVDVCRHNVEKEPTSGRTKGILGVKLLNLVTAQIEMRDYEYVAQSDTLVAVNTAIIADVETLHGLGLSRREAEELAGVYLPVSTGMDAELQRARSLSKPITYYVLPLCLDALLDGSRDPASVPRILSGEGFRRCTREGEAPIQCRGDQVRVAAMKCARRLQRGGLFQAVGGGVRICLSPFIVDRETGYEEMVEAYKSSICPG